MSKKLGDYTTIRQSTFNYLDRTKADTSAVTGTKCPSKSNVPLIVSEKKKKLKKNTGIDSGSRHSVWEASENMGYDLRRCKFSNLFSLFS